MVLHHLALWLLVVNLLFGPLVFAASAAAPDAPSDGVEASYAYPYRASRAGFLHKPGLYSSPARCACVVPGHQKVNWKADASAAAPGALRLAVAELAGTGPDVHY
jgi:hypothetical protein